MARVLAWYYASHLHAYAVKCSLLAGAYNANQSYEGFRYVLNEQK